MNLSTVHLLILDVDGVLTDGRVEMSAEGEPVKAFFVRDGAAIKLWQRAGGQVAIISGRKEQSVLRRAKELGIDAVQIGVSDKLAAYQQLLTDSRCEESSICYIGDDLPDLTPMLRCGFAVAVADAAHAVKRIAHYVTKRPGGRGAVAEVIELLLRKRGQWSNLVRESGIPPGP